MLLLRNSLLHAYIERVARNFNVTSMIIVYLTTLFCAVLPYRDKEHTSKIIPVLYSIKYRKFIVKFPICVSQGTLYRRTPTPGGI